MNLATRLRNALIDIDRAFNTLGGGKIDQTISGTAWRGFIRGKWWGQPLVALIDALLGQGHCERVSRGEA